MLQVAAATNCKHYYGVEKADIPATYAEVTKYITGLGGSRKEAKKSLCTHLVQVYAIPLAECEIEKKSIFSYL